jgi:LPXTG-motif cell wall-anchored protein
MLRLRLATIGVVVAVIGLMSANAAYAQCDYGIPAVTLDVDPDVVHDGGDVEGTATSDTPCDSWDVFNDFDGQTASGSGSSIDFEFSFPDVEDETDVTITAVCHVDECSDGTASETIELVGDPGGKDEDHDGDGKDHNGALPDTGGPDQTVIGAGIILMLAGGGAIYLARRRNEETA